MRKLGLALVVACVFADWFQEQKKKGKVMESQAKTTLAGLVMDLDGLNSQSEGTAEAVSGLDKEFEASKKEIKDRVTDITEAEGATIKTMQEKDRQALEAAGAQFGIAASHARGSMESTMTSLTARSIGTMKADVKKDEALMQVDTDELREELVPEWSLAKSVGQARHRAPRRAPRQLVPGVPLAKSVGRARRRSARRRAPRPAPQAYCPTHFLIVLSCLRSF